jgi:hypothetical protein
MNYTKFKEDMAKYEAILGDADALPSKRSSRTSCNEGGPSSNTEPNRSPYFSTTRAYGDTRPIIGPHCINSNLDLISIDGTPFSWEDDGGHVVTSEGSAYAHYAHLDDEDDDTDASESDYFIDFGPNRYIIQT